MQERIVEIIQKLIKEISHLPELRTADIEKIAKKLVKKGFSEGEVEKALEIIIAYLKETQPALFQTAENKNLPSLRLLNEAELSYFSKEAHGLLIQLQSLRILSPLHVEQVIDRAIMLGLPRVGLEDVKIIVSHVMVGRENISAGSKAVYHPGNERVN